MLCFTAKNAAVHRRRRRRHHHRFRRCNNSQVKKAYRTACVSWHPDKHASGGDDAAHRAHLMFQKVNEAHETQAVR